MGLTTEKLRVYQRLATVMDEWYAAQLQVDQVTPKVVEHLEHLEEDRSALSPDEKRRVAKEMEYAARLNDELARLLRETMGLLNYVQMLAPAAVAGKANEILSAYKAGNADLVETKYDELTASIRRDLGVE